MDFALHGVKALVVARGRELAEEPVLTAVSLGGLGFFALLHVMLLAMGTSGTALSICNAAILGMAVGAAVGTRVSSFETGVGGAAGVSVTGRALPALPVTALGRIAATTVLTLVFAGPFVALTLLATLSPRATAASVALTLGGFALGSLAFVVLDQVGRERIRHVLAFPNAWLAALRPARGSETSAVAWVLLPGFAMRLFMNAFLVLMLAWMMPMGVFGLGAAPLACALAGMVVYFGLLASVAWLAKMTAPLAALAASRRAVAFAELRLTPVRLALSCAITLPVVHAMAHSSSLTLATAHLVVALGGCEAVACVGWARVTTPSFGGIGVMLYGISIVGFFLTAPVLAGFVFVFAPSLVLAPVFDCIAVLAFVVAIGLAYRTPRSPLSRAPSMGAVRFAT